MLTCMIKTYTPMHLNESHGQKKVVFNLLTRLLTNFLYNILYKLTVGSPKTRLEFIKDVTDPLDSDYKEIEAFSLLVIMVHLANIPGKK